ncbi:hypothetical protein ILUMI_18153 [Ignelater luminosus]|uniref:Uncharacterized protein n=1 Tax=Ignelater luminosus TaxID=2038154 RepID=A0A8K0CIU6_IGNLU|nr:hypothetical protein ILUMI_18153 [Ignelater luminosus]
MADRMPACHEKRSFWPWIGRGGPTSWPPRSPDLTPLDYCLWRWFKDEVYKVKVDTRDALIQRIKNTASDIKDRSNQESNGRKDTQEERGRQASNKEEKRRPCMT